VFLSQVKSQRCKVLKVFISKVEQTTATSSDISLPFRS